METWVIVVVERNAQNTSYLNRTLVLIGDTNHHKIGQIDRCQISKNICLKTMLSVIQIGHKTKNHKRVNKLFAFSF